MSPIAVVGKKKDTFYRCWSIDIDVKCCSNEKNQ
jgi:hypothetical protein